MGEEVIFIYNGKKYFAQGYTNDDGVSVHEVQLWEPAQKLLWRKKGGTAQDRMDAFETDPIFEGKSFVAD